MQPRSLDNSQSINGGDISCKLSLEQAANGDCNLEDVVLSEEEDLIPEISAQLNLEGGAEESQYPFEEEYTTADIFCFKVGKEVRCMFRKKLPEYFICFVNLIKFKVVEVKDDLHIENVAKYFKAFFRRSTMQQKHSCYIRHSLYISNVLSEVLEC